jgi:hypothetical protein
MQQKHRILKIHLLSIPILEYQRVGLLVNFEIN